jgi:hypothetical protein
MLMRRRVPETDFSGTPVLRCMTVNTLFKRPAEQRWKELAAWVVLAHRSGFGLAPVAVSLGQWLVQPPSTGRIVPVR